MESAASIYQDLLDVLSKALLTGDEENFVPYILCPHQMITETLTIDMPDEKKVRKHFAGYCDTLAANGVTDYVRIVEEAEFLGDDIIVGRHRAHMLRGATEVAQPFQNRLRLERVNGVWGVRTSRHMARYISWPELLPHSGRPNENT